MAQLPPKYALRFLRWFCREDAIDEIEGDLTELFEKERGRSPKKARWIFFWSVLRYFRPEFIKSFRTSQSNAIPMFRHNLLITYRNVLRHKSTFVINLVGLSVALATVLLIYLWIDSELKMDTFHAYDNRLYQMMENYSSETGVITHEASPDALANTLATNIPDVEYAATITPTGWFPKFILTAGDKMIRAEGKFADKDFFRMFSYRLTEGNPAHALTDKNGIVITESTAKKLFGSAENLTGKSIEWQVADFHKTCIITGIVADVGENSSDKFDMVMTMDSWRDFMPMGKDDLDGRGPNTYIVLREGSDVTSFDAKANDLLKTKSKFAAQRHLFARKYSDRYLHNEYINGVNTGGRITYVKMFTLIGLFVLLMACINFMNLFTAKAFVRGKEVGVKKVIGAARRTLVIQYLTESLFTVFLSLGIALLMAYLLLPAFNNFTGKQLAFVFQQETIVALVLLALLTGLISGGYPALYLSGINSLQALKGKMASAAGELWARKGLVVIQFSLSVLFITSVIVIYRQINFVGQKHTGYDKEHIIYFAAEGKLADHFDAFIAEAKKIPGVLNATSIIGNIVGDNGPADDVSIDGKKFPLKRIWGNYDLLETMNVPMVAGRTYSRDFNESQSVIFNQTAIDMLGIDEPIGKEIQFNDQQLKIVGVTKDFHFQSLYEKIRPLAVFVDTGRQWHIMLRMKAVEEEQTIARVTNLYKTLNPGFEFDYRFLDHEYQQQYAGERQVATLSKYFAILAIVISCLGLYGLAAFSASRRVKEIGIRKVLGSGELAIVWLLSSDFMKMLVVAISIALPISYFGADYWLDHFAYRIPLHAGYFLVSGTVTMVLAWLTISTQTFSAARANPVKSLKSD